MAVEINLSQVFVWVLGAFIAVLSWFIKDFVSKTRDEIAGLKNKLTTSETLLHNFELKCAEHYAKKSDIADSRQEIVGELKELSKKIDALTETLHKKADRT